MKKTVMQIIFWGSLWGLAEATVGFIIHWAAVALPGLPGFLMFPIAYLFMDRAVSDTGLPSAAFHVSLVAAMLKFTDFLIPGHDALRIVNPALSILFEGLAVYAVIRYLSPQRRSVQPVQAFAMGFAWRGLFLIHLWAISLFGLPASLVTDGLGSSMCFLLVESLINATLIAIYMGLSKKRNLAAAPIAMKPAYVFAVLAAAMISQSLL